MFGGDGAEGDAGNLEGGGGPVAEKLCITDASSQKCLPLLALWGWHPKAGRPDQISGFSPCPQLLTAERFSRVGTG